mmetsp:Transcript_25533/g.61399  ORF Transcript_25533/g.61399 Transcript_25533/m.61399 type:complete len:103 (-) Transcript_25533:489-797(-)
MPPRELNFEAEEEATKRVSNSRTPYSNDKENNTKGDGGAVAAVFASRPSFQLQLRPAIKTAIPPPLQRDWPCSASVIKATALKAQAQERDAITALVNRRSQR